MARVPLVDPSSGDIDPDAQRTLEEVGGGIYPNVYRAIANHPGALKAFSGFGKLIYVNNSISPSYRELAYLTASAVNQCHY